jgi:hypothetical protein
MRKSSWPLRIGIAYLLAIGIGFSTASAGLITTVSESDTTLGDGSTRYDYVLATDSLSTLAAIQLQISVGPDTNPTNPTGPVGWDFLYDNVFQVVTWFSEGPSSDILPGQSGQFSLVSLLTPGIQQYSIVGIDENTGDSDVALGAANAPTTSSGTVPEPASLVLVGAGAIVLICHGAAGRWRRSPVRM